MQNSSILAKVAIMWKTLLAEIAERKEPGSLLKEVESLRRRMTKAKKQEYRKCVLKEAAARKPKPRIDSDQDTIVGGKTNNRSGKEDPLQILEVDNSAVKKVIQNPLCGFWNPALCFRLPLEVMKTTDLHSAIKFIRDPVTANEAKAAYMYS
ncbi:hypothetical protein FQA39_LY19035 [Lamprigera yunnana]|nr:hypothetical protein FQA39_LY19035 [Lamprigera yunnana]